MTIKYFVVECDLFEDAADLRDAILDTFGYPLKFQSEPDLLKVREIDDPSALTPAQSQSPSSTPGKREQGPA